MTRRHVFPSSFEVYSLLQMLIWAFSLLAPGNVFNGPGAVFYAPMAAIASELVWGVFLVSVAVVHLTGIGLEIYGVGGPTHLRRLSLMCSTSTWAMLAWCAYLVVGPSTTVLSLCVSSIGCVWAYAKVRSQYLPEPAPEPKR